MRHPGRKLKLKVAVPVKTILRRVVICASFPVLRLLFTIASFTLIALITNCNKYS